MPGFLLRRRVICFNPGPLVIWCSVNDTILNHSPFRKVFQVHCHLSEIFYRNLLTNGKRSRCSWKIILAYIKGMDRFDSFLTDTFKTWLTPCIPFIWPSIWRKLLLDGLFMQVPKVSALERIHFMSQTENYLIIVDRSTHGFHRITSIFFVMFMFTSLFFIVYFILLNVRIKGFVLSLDCHKTPLFGKYGKFSLRRTRMGAAQSVRLRVMSVFLRVKHWIDDRTNKDNIRILTL